MRKRSALTYIFCVTEFVRLFSVIHSAFLHVFPYNFVVTVCNIYKYAQIASFVQDFAVIFVRCGVELLQHYVQIVLP